MKLRHVLPLSMLILTAAVETHAQDSTPIDDLPVQKGRLDQIGEVGHVDRLGRHIQRPGSALPVFSKSSGTAAPGDEHWEGGFASPGLNGTVRALALDGSGNLFAGGEFTTAGGVSANRVAKWDGQSWSALGSPTEGMDGTVYALAVDSLGNLYAGGSFTTAGGVEVKNVARWDGESWSAMGSVAPFLGTDAPVYALTVDPSGNLYAGGAFFMAGTTISSHVAKWNGVSWTPLSSGIGGDVLALALDGSGNLYAGGDFAIAGGLLADNVAMWNGSAWSALGSGTDGDVKALAVGANGNLYAGGSFFSAGGVTTSYVAKWSGSSWSALGSPIQGTNLSVNVLAADVNGDVYAGGWFTEAGGDYAGNHVAKWNGSSWSSLGSGMNNVVYALAADGGLFVGGEFSSAGGKPATRIAKWNGPMGARVSASAILEGPYAGSGLMSTTLNTHLPSDQPFDVPPWSYPGTESVSSFPPETVDWLLLELRSDSTAGSVFKRQAVLLLSDGSIVDKSGTNLPSFKAVIDDSAYVVLHSRNHLSLMTPQRLRISGSTWTHDFTSSADAAYSDHGAALKNLGDGYFGPFAGDANADGFVQALDFNAYIDQTPEAPGYKTADFNMDGNVQEVDFDLLITNALTGVSSQLP